MAKQAKVPYVKGTNGTKPTPKVIPPKPVEFAHTQNTGVTFQPAPGKK